VINVNVYTIIICVCLSVYLCTAEVGRDDTLGAGVVLIGGIDRRRESGERVI